VVQPSSLLQRIQQDIIIQASQQDIMEMAANTYQQIKTKNRHF
jgi:hypothetical protein